METRMFFVRHGDSHHKRDGVVGGAEGCRGLTDEGRGQAALLARRLAADIRLRGTAGTAGSAEAGDREGKGDAERAGGVGVAIYTSPLPRAVETAAAISAAVGRPAVPDCGLCTWHTPPEADGLKREEFLERFGIEGGGLYRPFQRGNETWAEMVTRTSRTITELADRHRGESVVLVGHAETVEISFNALGLLPIYRSFDLTVAPGSVTEWSTGEDPARWPPPRWTLRRFNVVPEEADRS
jgi:2,3-bisphosphoglycerate-dependent phosphoglycerate mutase